jgi:hypothetical protein
MLISKHDIGELGINPVTLLPPGQVISESELIAKIESEERYKAFLKGIPPDIEVDRYDDLLSSWNLEPYKEPQVKSFYNMWKESEYRFGFILRENYYRYAVVDIIMQEYHSTLVPIMTTYNHDYKELEYTRYLERHSKRIVECLENRQWSKLPTEILSDDEIIEEQVRELVMTKTNLCILIQTKDKALVRRLNLLFKGYCNDNNISIIYYDILNFLNGVPIDIPLNTNVHEILDMGALQTVEELYFFNGVYHPKGVLNNDPTRPFVYDADIDASKLGNL